MRARAGIKLAPEVVQRWAAASAVQQVGAALLQLPGLDERCTEKETKGGNCGLFLGKREIYMEWLRKTPKNLTKNKHCPNRD
jgi:hypothetical protein